MDRPFGELHELYRIIFLRREAQIKAEEERKKKEAEEEARKNNQKGYRPSNQPQLPNKYPYQQNKQTEISDYPSLPLQDMDSMEDALEEFIEGGGY